MKRGKDGCRLTLDLGDFNHCPNLVRRGDAKFQTDITQEFTLEHHTSRNDSQYTFNSVQTPNNETTPVPGQVSLGYADKGDTPDLKQWSKLIWLLRGQFQGLKQSSVKSQLQEVDRLLNTIQNKLQAQTNTPPGKLSRLYNTDTSPIKKLGYQHCETPIHWTEINLAQLLPQIAGQSFPKEVDSRKPSVSGIQELESVDNIEYYKIMYLLGEDCGIGGARSRNLSNVSTESVTIRQLNMDIEMLDKVLETKTLNFNHLTNQESLKSTKRIRTPKCNRQQRAVSPLQRLRCSLMSTSKSRLQAFGKVKKVVNGSIWQRRPN